MGVSIWPDDERNAMRVLFHAGLTATEAARRFSKEYAPVKRNAIVGVWFRMGLRRRETDNPPGNVVRRREPDKANEDRSQIQRIKRKCNNPFGNNTVTSIAQRVVNAAKRRAADQRSGGFYAQPEPSFDEEMERAKHACGLLELTNTTCRWPCGDVGAPGFFFCGVPEAALDQRRPYCRGHSRIATQ